MAAIGDPLTPQEEAFCVEYVTNGGDQNAAVRKVYDCSELSDKSVYEKSSRIRRRPAVRERISQLQDSLAALAVVSEASVIQEVARIAFADVADLFDHAGKLLPVHQIPAHARASITGVELENITVKDKDGNERVETLVKKYLRSDKGTALFNLMKHLGSFEQDNRQRAGIFDKLPAGEAQRIQQKLQELAREPTAPSPSTLKH